MASDNDGNYDTPKLPEDLLLEIFLRLVVESLLRAKCVCKYWYGLIEDPSFAYKHLEYQKKSRKCRFLLQNLNAEALEHKYAILDDISQSSTTYRDLGYLHIYNPPLNMEGPVDGLYCLSDIGERIVLWNPALMDFKTIPLPPQYYLPHYEVAFGTVGFGKDPLTNDYKVVITRNFSDKLSNFTLDFTAVYNLRTNTWRNLDLGELANLDFGHGYSNSFLDGTYHWWSYSGVVLAFDMGNETFRVIRGPDLSQFDRKDRLYCDLTVYEERVALTHTDDTSVSIWVMLEEGFWIKQYSIGPFPGLVTSLGFSTKGVIFLVIDDTETEPETEVLRNAKMVLYDINTQEMKNFGERAYAFGFRTCAYYESLLSISGRTSCKGELDPWKRVADFFNKRSCN